MIQTAARLLGAAAPWLSERLVPPSARRRIAERAAAIPSAWAWLTVECRLRADDQQVDLLVAAARGPGGGEALGRALADGGAAPWGAARPLLEAWVREGTPVHREMPVMWLEYDIPPAGEPPAPFAFVSLDRDYLDEQHRASRRPRAQSASEVRCAAAAGLALATGEPADAAALDHLERAVALLSPEARVFQVAATPHRGTRDLRLGVWLAAERLAGWLDAVGWPGAPRQLEAHLAAVGPGFGDYHVQIDLGEVVRPSLSLDFNSPRAPSQSAAWRELVERLARAGACDRERGLAALGWVGRDLVRLDGVRWPLVAERHLFFKLVSRPPDRLEAKAYLSIHLRPRL